MGYVSHDALVGLVADDVAYVGYSHTERLCHLLEGMDHVVAGTKEHVLAVGHGDSVFVRTELNAIWTFADVAQATSVDCLNCHVGVGNRLFRYEVCHSSIAPKVTALGVALVAVVGVVFRADEKSLCGFSHSKISFNDFKTVDKRRASR